MSKVYNPDLVEVFKSHFGFEQETADTLVTIMDSISDVARSDIEERPYVLPYIFFRSLGGMCYGDGNVLIDGAKWGQVAGFIDNVYKYNPPFRRTSNRRVLFLYLFRYIRAQI